MNKKVKIAIISFVVLGVTGMAILKGKQLVDGYLDKKRKKSGKPKKVDSFSQLFELPEELKK